MIEGLIAVVIFSLGAGAAFFVATRIAGQRLGVLEANSKSLALECAQKRELLEEIATVSLSLCSKDELEAAKKARTKAEDSLKTERGKLAITRAEMQSVETRLCELEELERELENSAFEAKQELERLNTEVSILKSENESLTRELQNSMSKLDNLLDELAHSQEAIDILSKTKADMLETQRQIEFYEVEIEELNHSYMDLKRAYDALDIEYAQLYEKQSGSAPLAP